MNYKQIIKDKGLKQTWIAERVGISNAMLSLFLNNKANLDPRKEMRLKLLLKN